MTFPIRYPDGRNFGPYSLEELKAQASQGSFPPNTEIEANGEWVSLGGWLVVQKRLAQLEADAASRPQAAASPAAPASGSSAILEKHTSAARATGLQTAQSNTRAIGIGVALFIAVVAAALLLR